MGRIVAFDHVQAQARSSLFQVHSAIKTGGSRRGQWAVCSLPFAACPPHAGHDSEDTMPKCLECDAEIDLDETVEEGEIVDCPDCGTAFEVKATSPVTLDYAPKEEEDWGE
jgi:alpha-aminoadipate carrier protein LysW